MASREAKRILVTRSAARQDRLVRAIEKLGGRAVLFPTHDIRPLAPAVPDLDRFDAVLFTSAHGVCYFPVSLKDRVVGAVGPETARHLRSAGAKIRWQADPPNVQGLLKVMGDVAGMQFLLAQGNLSRPELEEGLLAKGAEVEKLAVYDNVPRHKPEPDGLAAILAGEVDAIILMSPSALHGLLQLLDPYGGRGLIEGVPLISVGPTTSQAVREAGLTVHRESPSPLPEEMAKSALGG